MSERPVRSDDPDADVIVFWRDWEGGAPRTGDDLDGPPLDLDLEACPVALWPLQEFLKAMHRGGLGLERSSRALEPDISARPEAGMTLMLRGDVGGYSRTHGWTGVADHRLNDLPPPGRRRALRDDWRAETGYWSSLASYLADARREAERICDVLAPQGLIRKAVVEAAGLHDLVAHLRFSVIGQLLAAPPTKGQLRAAIASLAARQWCHPGTL